MSETTKLDNRTVYVRDIQKLINVIKSDIEMTKTYTENERELIGRRSGLGWIVRELENLIKWTIFNE